MDKIDYQGRNDALVKAIVMAGDLVLCNLLFYLFCHFGEQTGQSLLQSCLLISAVYFGCTVRGGVILHRRTKVRKFQIISVVLRNMFYFTIVATVLLAWGGFARPTAGYYTVFLVAMFAAISCFRLLLRWVLKQYWKRIRHRNGVVFVGSTENNMALYNELAGDPSIGYRVCGYFDTKPNEYFPKKCPYLGTPEDVIPYLEEHRETVRSLYCCLPSRMNRQVLQRAERAQLPLPQGALQHDGQRALPEPARGAAELDREPDAEAGIRHRLLAVLPLHAVYPDPDHCEHHHENHDAGPGLLPSEAQRPERKGVLLPEVPQHEGERAG